MWRFSVKKRAVLRIFSIISRSDLWAIELCFQTRTKTKNEKNSADDDGFRAVEEQARADGDDALPEGEPSFDGHRVADDLAEANVTKQRLGFFGVALEHEHRETARIVRRAQD